MKTFYINIISLLSLCLSTTVSMAAEYRATPQTLDVLMNHLVEGDKLVLQKGSYHTNLIVERSIAIHCEDQAIIDANHHGDAIRVKAPLVVIENCTIRNWGSDLTEMNAGIFVEPSSTNTTIIDNQLNGDAFGIWVDAAKGVRIENNQIEGNIALRSQDRGNGIHLFNVRDALVSNNRIWHTRDGIYIDTSNQNQLVGNYLHDLRYGIHYMYSYSNRLERNHTKNTRTGYALMQSKYLTVVNNISENDTNYGILMNFITRSTLSGNRIVGTHQQQGPGGMSVVNGAEGKALFIYNSQFNQISDNRFEASDLGIHLTAGSEDNEIYSNVFINNRQQVKYVANRLQEWSKNGRGNFWSDYMGWDKNADGIGDQPYEPNDSMDKILWKYPAAKFLLNSPAIETLRFVERSFPILKSPGVKDSFPLMSEETVAQLSTAPDQVD